MRSGAQRAGTHQIFGVPLGVDVIGDGGDLEALAQRACTARPSARSCRSRPGRRCRPAAGRASRSHRSAPEQPRVLASHAACWRDRRGTPRCRGRRAWRSAPGRRSRDDRLQRGQHALAVGLPERNEPHAGGDEIREPAPADRHAAPASSGMPWPAPVMPTATVARPARPSIAQQRSSAAQVQAALIVSRKARPCAIVSRWRSFEGEKAAASSATSRSAASSPPAIARWACTKNTRRKTRCPRRSSPSSQRSQRHGIGDVARFDRPFHAAGIRESADRKGRRKPRHQPVERAGASAVAAA